MRVHLHAVERGGRLWRDHICFRDLLRTDKARRSEYEDLKRRLATLHADDKSAYTLEKDVYIRSMLSSMED